MTDLLKIVITRAVRGSYNLLSKCCLLCQNIDTGIPQLASIVKAHVNDGITKHSLRVLLDTDALQGHHILKDTA